MPFKLGAEYDYCCHKTVSPKDVKKSTKQPMHVMSALNFIDSDTVCSKCNIDEHLQLSVYTGLINMSDHKSANTLMHHFCNKSMALHFQCVTEVENSYPSKCSHNQATHVVGEVRYGLEVFFIIDQDAHQFENDMTFRSKIENAIENKSFDEVANVHGTLVLFADEKFELPCEVKKIEDMNLLYSLIETSLQGKQINGIPIAVKLHPFKKINSIATTKQAIAIVQNLHSTTIKCAQMLKASALNSLLSQGVKAEIEVMSEYIQKYTKKIQTAIASVLPQIYGGSKDASELRNILQKHYTSPFSRELDIWIANISKAITTSQEYSSPMEGKSYSQLITIIHILPFCIEQKNVHYTSSRKEVEKMMAEFESVKYAVCMEFIDVVDGYCDKAISYVTESSSVDQTKPTQWHNDEDFKKCLKCNIDQFIELATFNELNKHVIFVVISDRKDMLQTAKSDILAYSVQENNFTTVEVHCKPNKPTIDTNNGIIHWELKNPSSLNVVQSYRIAFSASEADTWTLLNAGNPAKLSAEIRQYLQPNTSYVFKIAAVYKYCPLLKLVYSDESEPFRISESTELERHITRPGKPQVCRIEPNAIILRWEKSCASSDNAVHQYMVYYRLKNSDGETYWNIVETTDTTTMITVDNLFGNLPYLFKVVAVGKCGISEESEESDVITIRDHIPSKPGKPSVLASSRDSITITWDVPQHNTHLVSRYMVKCFTYQPVNKVLTTVTKDAMCTCTINNLSPDTYYTFEVLACTHCGISEKNVSGIIKTIDRCSPPGKPIAVVTPPGNAVKLTWDMPMYNAHLVKLYYVQRSVHGHPPCITEKTTNDKPEYTFVDLERNQCYDFNVAACDSHSTIISTNSSELSDPVYIHVKSASQIDDAGACAHVHHGEPIKSKCSSVNAGKPDVIDISYDEDEDAYVEITVSWAPPKVEKRPKEYQLFICCIETSKDYELKKKSSKSGKFKVKKLEPSQNYKIKVVAVYDEKTRVESQEIVVNASEEISSPGKPTTTEVTDTSITLNWTPPIKNFDLIKGYMVIYENQDLNTCSSTTVEANVTEVTVDGLIPNATYTFYIIAKGKLEFDSKESEQISVSTKSGVPSKPVLVQHGAISHNEVSLCWQPPVSADNITRYCVYYNSDSDLGQVYTSNSEPQVLITYLQPNTSYTFNVVSMCGDILSGHSEESESIKTEPYACSEPGRPIADDSNFDEVALSWTEPIEHSHVITSYTIICSLKENGQEIAAEEMGLEIKAKFMSLQPNTDYTFRVIAHCKSGASIAGPCSTIRTMKKVCTSPGVPIMTRSTHNSLSLTWQEPAKNSKLVNKYIIYNCKRSSALATNRAQQCCVTNDSKPEATVHDLAQNTEYSFQVAADCNGNLSKPSPTSEIMRTKKACSKPGKPVMTEYTYNSILLKWDKPTVQSDIVKYYIIRSCEDSINHQTKANHFKIENLSPNTTYTFQVIAHCDDDVDITSEVSGPIRTDKAICSPPRDLTVSNETEYSALVRWKAPVKYPELVKTYVVKYQLKSDSSGNWECLELKATAEMQLINNLKPDSSYKIKVYVQHSDANVTCECKAIAFMTLPDVCSAPGTPTSADVTYNRIMLTWDEPKCHKNLLQHYSIMIYMYQDNAAESIENQTEKPQIVLDNLQPDTEYRFKVIAVCKLASSESELSSPIRTKQELCSPPGVPTASSTTHNSITLRWNKPTECAHLIQYYDVYYKYSAAAGEGEWERRSTSEVQENKEINQLLPDTKYVFKVKAVCTNDTESEFSPCSKDIATRKRKLVEDLIPKASAIPPTPEELLCYQLKPLMHKAIESSELEIAKYTFGKPPKNIPEKILLLVGATGAGKSTMINGIVNYIFGVVSRDNYRLKLIHQESKMSQAHSQTRWITSYTFYWQEGFPFPYTLTVIDTPGFGDTDGIVRDRKLRQQIKQFFGLKAKDGGMEVVHGIGFLTQASLVRLTQTQRYIFDSMLAIFGNDVKKNIFILATFDDGGKSQIKQSISDAGIPTDKFYTFNNGTLFQQQKSDDAVWLKNYADFFQKLPEVTATSIQLSEEVLQEREHLQTVIEGLSQQVKIGLGEIDKLAQIHDELEKIQLKVMQSKDFKIKAQVQDFRYTYLDKVYVTNCTQCTYTCHYPCAYPNDGEKYKCSAMDRTKKPRTDTTCRVCPKKCSWKLHKNNGIKIEPYMKDVITTNKELEAEYHQAIKDEKDKESVLGKMKSQMKQVYLKVGESIREMNQCLTKLKEIALKPDYITDEGYIDLLIQSEEEEAKEGYQKRIKYLQLIRRDIKIIAAAKNADPNSFDHDKFFDELKGWNANT